MEDKIIPENIPGVELVRIQSATDSNNKSQKKNDKKRKRKKQWTIIYWGVILSTLLSGFESIVVFALGLQLKIMFQIFYAFTLFKLFWWVLSAIQLEHKQVIKLFFILDSLLIKQLSCSLCIDFIFYLMKARHWYHIVLQVIIIIMNHFYSINFRIMLAYADWTRWQTIIYKGCLGLLILYHLAFGAIFLSYDQSFQKYGNAKLNENITSFIGLFTFVNLNYPSQLMGAVSVRDGTDDLKTKYYLEDVDDDTDGQSANISKINETLQQFNGQTNQNNQRYMN